MKIIFISLDTLCAGHLGCYGYRLDTTPRIDEWAERGVLYERCYATDVPTPPSYTAMFSGRFGMHTGIFGFQAPHTYKSGPPLIAQHLHHNGYETCAISNLFYPIPWLLSGWRTIIPPGVRFQGGKAPDVTDDALAWLDRHGAKDDFFLFVHYWEPHQPYNKAPEAHRKRFPPDEYRGRVSDMSMLNQNPIMRGFYEEYHSRGEGDPNLIAEDVTARYDAQIHYVDEEVGRLFDYLDKAGLTDDTAVIITSDHGEAFGEYGSFDHYTCYENICHVPLIIRAPNLFPADRRIDGLVCGADLYPTICDFAGIDTPVNIDGRSLIPCSTTETDTPHGFIVTDCNALAAQRMIVRGNRGLVQTMNHGPFIHIKPYEMFDLYGDPERDILEDEPETARSLREALDEWVLEMSDGGPDPLQIAAFEGGWALSQASFLSGVAAHIEEAKSNGTLWNTLCKMQGRAMNYVAGPQST